MIRHWLEQQEKDDIIRQFVAVITKDRYLKNTWLLKAETGLGRMDKRAIKKQITAAFPLNKHIYEYPKVRTYFATAIAILQELEQPLCELPADEQMVLVEYAFERLTQALETVDDSGGFRYDSLSLLQGLFIRAFQQLKCPDEKKAGTLLKIALTDEYNFYGQIPADYKECLSPHCLALFYKQAQEQWDALPPFTGDSWSRPTLHYRLEQLLTDRARQEDDYEALIAIKVKTATHSHDYQELAELHFERKDYDQTAFYLKKAKSLDSHGRDSGHGLQVKLYQATGQGNEAVVCQWQYFQKHTNLVEYRKLLAIAKQEGNETDWPTQTIVWLSDHLEEKDTWHRSYGHYSPRSDTLVGIYLMGAEWEKAWNIVQGFQVADDLALNLARESAKASLEKHWERILRVFTGQASGQIEQGNNEAYQQGVSLLVELHGLTMGTPYHHRAEQEIAGLKETYRRKRNFVSYLNNALTI
ncbi:hypothetical protein [Parendozoicomonas sp. Alg238-R29]|uniref:hypothetical protein n=1 Tax=Parendozoicomonas sp. Alg238-R29 TaxID=2993446 RepID=UPI00248E7F10|nr:hypothetical protein [Parendozoicomonas sp. Alg238-R29]